MTYGQYWSDILKRYPVNKVTIGNPFIDMKLKLLDNEPYNSKIKRILFVSDGNQTNVFFPFAVQLKEYFGHAAVISYRPHPAERTKFIMNYKHICSNLCIEISTEKDPLNDMIRFEHIVGIRSTMLFEALPFQKSIHIYENSYSQGSIPKKIGTRFSTTEELYENILRTKDKPINDKTNYYWNMNWKKNFRNFRADVCKEN